MRRRVWFQVKEEQQLWKEKEKMILYFFSFLLLYDKNSNSE